MPYGMYATGLGYRADKVSDMTGSWATSAEADAEGKIFMLDDFQEAIGMANTVNGYELNASDDEELEKTKQYADRPEAAAARLLERHDHEHAERQRLDPAPLERRHRERPQPGRRPGALQVPEVQGGHPGRQRHSSRSR